MGKTRGSRTNRNSYSNPILVATDIIVRITDLRKRQKMNIIDELNDFINQTCIV